MVADLVCRRGPQAARCLEPTWCRCGDPANGGGAGDSRPRPGAGPSGFRHRGDQGRQAHAAFRRDGLDRVQLLSRLSRDQSPAAQDAIVQGLDPGGSGTVSIAKFSRHSLTRRSAPSATGSPSGEGAPRCSAEGRFSNLVQAMSLSATACLSFGSYFMRLKLSANHRPSLAMRMIEAKTGSRPSDWMALWCRCPCWRTGSTRSGKLVSAAVIAPLTLSKVLPVMASPLKVAVT